MAKPDRHFMNVFSAVLGILVAVRIALSISLDIEVDGMVPWHRAASEVAARDAEPHG